MALRPEPSSLHCNALHRNAMQWKQRAHSLPVSKGSSLAGIGAASADRSSVGGGPTAGALLSSPAAVHGLGWAVTLMCTALVGTGHAHRHHGLAWRGSRVCLASAVYRALRSTHNDCLGRPTMWAMHACMHACLGIGAPHNQRVHAQIALFTTVRYSCAAPSLKGSELADLAV